MPATVKKNTSSQSTNDGKMNDILTENENLKKENAELSEKVTQLLDKFDKLMNELDSKKTEQPTVNNIHLGTDKDETVEYEEPNANSQIKVMSTCYGSLNLCNTSNRSVGKLLTFSKFGQIKSVLYHDLVDFVNNERKFAEQGYFYILDKNAVYSLGLSAEYDKLVDANIMNNILNYHDSEIHAIVSSMTRAQQETLVNLLADKLYNDENLDRNKIEIINKIVGIDIQAKANQKKEFANVKTPN